MSRVVGIWCVLQRVNSRHADPAKVGKKVAVLRVRTDDGKTLEVETTFDDRDSLSIGDAQSLFRFMIDLIEFKWKQKAA